MKCSLCGMEYDEEKASKSCAGCIMAKKCGLVKCPNCGFETPPEPEWLKRRRRRIEENERKGPGGGDT